jgi:glutathione S-transferase
MATRGNLEMTGSASSPAFVVHGLTASYFTRKVTGYLDYKGLRWRLAPSVGINLEARAAGWNGGIPVVVTPAGETIWDSTSIILHLETRHPEPAVVPDDPALAFLGHVIEDFADEWLYRPAVGTRWLYPENTLSGSWDLAREATFEVPEASDDARKLVSEAMTACLPRLGVTPQNIEAWVRESVLPWQRAVAAHVEAHGYLLGGRPSLADFALFGGNVAHFVNDPLCRRWMDENARAVVAYTHAMAYRAGAPGEWLDADELPDTLIDLLAEIGRHYLPWVVEATRCGTATVCFRDGSEARVETTNFLNVARGILLARYVKARTPKLDGLLQRAGILRHFADHTDQATAAPDPAPPPRPADNQPFRAGP